MPTQDDPGSSLDLFVHDVRSDLTIVRGHAQVLARKARSPEGVDRDRLIAHLDRLDEAAGRAIQHVADFVERQRGDRGSG